jgi:glucose dehydrogenase
MFHPCIVRRMKRTQIHCAGRRGRSRRIGWIVTAILVCGQLTVGGQAQRNVPRGEWRQYAGDAASTKYSPLDQINRGNVQNLQVAWRWSSADNPIAGTAAQYRPGGYQDTPILANGVLYTETSLGIFVALDPASGREIWRYDPETWKGGRPPNLGFTHRGMAYWTDGKIERLISGTHDAYIISIDAKTGKLDPAFGAGGRVDAVEYIAFAQRTRNIAINSAPVIVKNVIVSGANITDGPVNKEAPRGDVSGYDVRTGKRLWTFRSIPQPGELGNETWENGSAEYSGNTNVWPWPSADEELGYVYLPFGTPTNDYYGGYRHGNNLFAESIVCLDATTGKRVWHFQGVHHGLWDYDFPAAPIMTDLTVDGRRIKALAQVSKQGFVYVLDRTTGVPVWPIEERPVPQSTMVGEKTAATQPFPTRPPAFERQGLLDDDVIDFTPELRARALEALAKFDRGPLFTPPSEKGAVQLPGNVGGANWGGGAFDPATGMLYVPSISNAIIVQLVKQDPARGNMEYRRGGIQNLPTLDGLKLWKPPYSRVTAYDLNKGTIAWQAPVGNGPREHPLLKSLGLGPLGSGARASAVVTASLLFVTESSGGLGAGEVLPVGDRPLSNLPPEPPKVRAFDKATGQLVWERELPVRIAASPMTYMHQGKQYLVMAIGSGAEAELIAFALP